MSKVLLIFLGALVLFAGAAQADDWFSDNFNGGGIDPNHWRWDGQITEAGGTLNLVRQAPVDSIATISSYSGDYDLQLDSRLDYIVWNDMFHGIAVMNRTGLGISFGYSMYGSLYLAVNDGNQTSYYYAAAGSNDPGQWQHWLLSKQGSLITVSVNGNQIFGPIGPVPEGCRIFMPGIYQDGDGGPHQGNTSSTVDNFAIAPASSGVEVGGRAAGLSTWGMIKESYAR